MTSISQTTIVRCDSRRATRILYQTCFQTIQKHHAGCIVYVISVIVYVILSYRSHLFPFLVTSFHFKHICCIFYEPLPSSGVGAAWDAARLHESCSWSSAQIGGWMPMCTYLNALKKQRWVCIYAYKCMHTPIHPSPHTLSVPRKPTWSSLQQSSQTWNDSHRWHAT